MKQIWITRAGGPDVLELREAADPVPGPGEVLVDVRAAGVNFADVMARMGAYPDAPPIPCVVGYEVAGTVVQAKAGAAPRGEPTFAPGERVFGLTRFGGYSTRVSVPAGQLFRIPDGMSFTEAAAIPVNYFTACLALIRFANLQPDESVLIHNAGGGVGIAAIQLARRIGARIYGTASAWKHERLRELGAHELIDYRTDDWVAAIRSRTSGAGVHVILDPIGGRNLRRDLEVLAPLGRLSAFGLSEPVGGGRRSLVRTLRSVLGMPRPHFITLLNRNWAIGGLNLGHLWGEIHRMRPIAEDLLAAWRDGFVRPEIAAEVPFDRPADAHRLLEERRNLGKVIYVVPAPREGERSGT